MIFLNTFQRDQSPEPRTGQREAGNDGKDEGGNKHRTSSLRHKLTDSQESTNISLIFSYRICYAVFTKVP